MPNPDPFFATRGTVTIGGDQGQAQPDADPFLATRGKVKLSQDPLFQVMTTAGLEQDAGRAAKILTLQDRVKLPSDYISDNLDFIEAETRKLEFNPEKFRESPAVKQWLSQRPEYTSIVSGNPGELDRLVQMEQVIRSDPRLRYRGNGFITRESPDGAYAEDLSTADFYKDFKLRQARGEIDAAERRSNAEELKKTFGPAHEIISGVYQSWASTLSAVQTGPKDPSKFQSAADVTQASVDLNPSFTGTLLRGGGGLIGDLPLMFAGGPLAAGAETLGLFARLGKTAKAIGQTAVAVQPLAAREGITTAQQSGGWNGLAAWGIETVIPASFGKTGVQRAVLKGLSEEASSKVYSGAALWLKEAGLEATEETVTELAHAIHEAASGIDPEALTWNKLAPRLAAAGILGGVAGGVFNAPEALAHIKEPGMAADVARVEPQSALAASVEAVDAAKGFKDRLDLLTKLAGESKTREAHGGSFDQLIQGMGAENEAVHFDPVQWNEYFQSKGLNPRLMAQQVLEDPEVYEESQATGAPIPVPLGKYISVLAVDHNAGLAPIAKADPSAFSESEATQEFQDLTNLPHEELDRIRNEARAQASAEAKVADPGVAIREKITEQLVAAGTDRSAAEAQATIAAAGFTTIAERWNANAAAEGRPQITADELFAKNFDRVARDLPKLIQAGSTSTTDALLDRLRAGDLPNEDTIYGPSLFEFLSKRGGVQDQGTELTTIGVDSNRRPFQKKLIRTDGLTLDRAAEAAHEAGYIPDAQINTLLEAMNQEAGGEKVRIPGDIANETQDAIRMAMLELQNFLGSQGINLADTTNEEIKALLAQPPTQAGGTELFQDDQGRFVRFKRIPASDVPKTKGATYRGVPNNGESGSGVGRLGNGLYSTTDKTLAKSFAGNDGEVFGVVGGGPSAPLRVRSPDAFYDWLLKESGENNIRSFNKKWPDIADFVRSRGYNGVIAGDEIVKYGDINQDLAGSEYDQSTELSRDTLKLGHLSPDAQAYVASLTPEQQQGLADSIAYLKNHPDPSGDVGNLQMIAEFNLRRAAKTLFQTFEKSKQLHEMRSGGKHRLIMLDGANVDASRIFKEGQDQYGAREFLSPVKVNMPGASESDPPQVVHIQGINNREQTSFFGRYADRSDSDFTMRWEGIDPDWIDVDGSRNRFIAERLKAALDARWREDGSRLTLWQQGDTKRGSIRFGETPEARRAVITLFEQANLSTFLHESGHLFLEVFTDLAARPDAPADFKSDLGILLDWFGVDSVAKIGVDQHEQFARGFEAYTMEGNAPSAGMREIFRRFKGWLTAIYKAIRNLNVNLTPEVRGVMDRMLASQESILDAQRVQNVVALPRETFPSDEAYASYLDAVAQSTEQAETLLRVELMNTERKAQKEIMAEERGRIRAMVADEVDQQPEFIAIAALQNGTRPDGQTLPDDLRGLKLDRAELVATFGEDALQRLPGKKPKGKEARGNPNNRGPDIYRAEGGLSLAEAASIFGFRDSAEMWEAIVNAPDRRKLIESKADAIMRERFPDPMTNGTLDAKAMAALHGEHRSALLLKELRALSVKTGRAAAPHEILRNVAKDQVGRQTIKDLRPDRYQVAERKAARAVEDALATGDSDGAFIAKQRELLNHELYRAATKAKTEAEKSYQYFKKLTTPDVRKKIGLAGGWEWTVSFPDGTTKALPDEDLAKAEAQKVPGATWDQTSGYLDQIDGLMADYEFRKVPNKVIARRGNFAQWVAQRAEAGETVAIPDSILTGQGKNWRSMTVDELAALRDSVKNIETMARLKNKLSEFSKNRNFLESLNEVLDTITANNRKRSRADAEPDRTRFDKLNRAIDGIIAAHQKMSVVALKADAGKEGGAFQRAIIDPVNAAGVIETERLSVEAQKFKALADDHAKAGRNIRERVEIRSLGKSLTLEQRIMWALNWGNEGNRERLLAGESERYGREITEADGQEVIDSLEPADWTLVNGILTQINSFWSEIASQERRMTGIAPEKVAASPFKTRHGIQPGGYFPIAYDAESSPKNLKPKQAEEVGYTTGTAANRTTAHGHTKERSRGLGTLSLSLDVASRHVTQVVHDLSFREPLSDISKWMSNPRFKEAIHDYFSPATLTEMESWRGDMARRDISENRADRWLRFIRNGASIATLGFNVGSAAVQIAGIGPSIQRVGAVNFARGVARLFNNPEATNGMLNFIYDKSAFMKTRNSTMIREIREGVRSMRGKAWLDQMRQASYWMISKAQIAVDAPTWMAAYEKSKAEGKADDAAVKIADQVVADTQGSGLAADLSGVQRSRITQLFTVFFTPAAATFAGTSNAFAAFRRAGLTPQSSTQLILDMISLYIIPSAITVATKAALGALVGGDDKDKESFAKKVTQETIGSVMNNFIGVRDFSGVIQGYGYSGPAGLKPFVDVGRSLQQLSQLYDSEKGFQSDQVDAGLAKALLNATGDWTHLPVRPVVQVIDGINWAEENGKNPILPVLLGKPRK
jgi:hypothetical protein